MDAIIDMNDFSVTITPSKKASDARDDSGYYDHASTVVADEYMNPGVGDAAAHIPPGTFEPQQVHPMLTLKTSISGSLLSKIRIKIPSTKHNMDYGNSTNGLVRHTT